MKKFIQKVKDILSPLKRELERQDTVITEFQQRQKEYEGPNGRKARKMSEKEVAAIRKRFSKKRGD